MATTSGPALFGGMQRRPMKLAWVDNNFEFPGSLEPLRQVADVDNVLPLIVSNQIQGLQRAASDTFALGLLDKRIHCSGQYAG